MRVVIQRVSHAKIVINEQEHCSVGNGLLLLLGIEEEDSETDVKWLSRKIINMRIFPDADGAMNLSLLEIGGDLLLVSQFTLYAQAKKGNRPSFIKAAKPQIAIPLYQMMIDQLNFDLGKAIKTGIFGADMQVELTNEGPVTILLDSKVDF